MRAKWLILLSGGALAVGCGGSIDAEPIPVQSAPEGEPAATDGEPSLTDGEPAQTNGDVAVERRQSGEWQFLAADAGQPYGRGTLTLSGYDLSLLLDAAGAPHIAYTAGAQPGEQLRHAWLANGVFQSEVVDEYGRAYKSWLRGAPDLRLVYNNHGYASLRFQAMRDASGAWLTDYIEIPSDAAALSGVWRDDRAQIAYVSALGRGSSETKQGVVFGDSELPDAFSAYTYETVAAYTALVLDASGTAHILYTAPASEIPKLSLSVPWVVRYVTVRDGEWSEPETLTEAGYYAGLSLAIDSDGRTHASFTRSRAISYEPYTAHSEVEYLSRSVGEANWQRETVDVSDNLSAARESLAVAADGTVFLAYCALDADGRRCNGLHLATLRDAVWSSETIDEGCAELGGLATLALGTGDSVHVAYQGCERELMYAVRGSYR